MKMMIFTLVVMFNIVFAQEKPVSICKEQRKDMLLMRIQQAYIPEKEETGCVNQNAKVRDSIFCENTFYLLKKYPFLTRDIRAYLKDDYDFLKANIKWFYGDTDKKKDSKNILLNDFKRTDKDWSLENQLSPLIINIILWKYDNNKSKEYLKLEILYPKEKKEIIKKYTVYYENEEWRSKPFVVNDLNDYASSTNSIKDSIMFEKFDFELDKTDYKNYERVANSRKIYGSNLFYQLKNGGVFYPNKGKNDIFYYVIPPLPYFYSISYMYFKNGNLHITGKIAGFHSGIKIGKWKYYDEIGRMTEVDEDEKFGLWTFEKVLERLDKDEVINLETGKNREANHLHFLFDKDKKIWTVKVFKKEKNQYVEEYWEYLFDGNTGKHSREWYEEYNDDIKGMMGEGMPMPPLKNSKKNKRKRLSEVY